MLLIMEQGVWRDMEVVVVRDVVHTPAGASPSSDIQSVFLMFPM